MTNIKYLVTSPTERGLMGEIDFNAYQTHDEALEFINGRMHDFVLPDFEFDYDDDIKPKDCTHWKDGQELEFLKHCAKIGEWWSCYAIYDLSNEYEIKDIYLNKVI